MRAVDPLHDAVRASTPHIMDEKGRLTELLRGNEILWACLTRLAALELPDWYLGAGCVAQTVWNAAHHKPAGADILDYDVAYFASDTSEGAEREVAAEAQSVVDDLGIRLDVKNQARVHLWYPDRFGYRIRPYASVEDAIRTWPTTASAVGVRCVGERLRVFAPFGFGDLLGLVVRPNRVQITPAIYEEKVARWRERWPRLEILPWDEGVGGMGTSSDV